MSIIQWDSNWNYLTTWNHSQGYSNNTNALLFLFKLEVFTIAVALWLCIIIFWFFFFFIINTVGVVLELRSCWFNLVDERLTLITTVENWKNMEEYAYQCSYFFVHSLLHKKIENGNNNNNNKRWWSSSIIILFLYYYKYNHHHHTQSSQ